MCFTNDLPDMGLSQMELFANDAKIFRGVGAPVDVYLLLKDLDNLWL